MGANYKSATSSIAGIAIVRQTSHAIWRFIAGIALLASLAACGLTQSERDAVAKFSRAASAMGATASAQLVEARDTVIALNTHYIALRPGHNPKTMDGALTPKDVGARVKAANTVQTYGELLRSLVEESQTAKLKAAAGNFTASIRGLDQQKAITDDQLNAVGKIVAGIGGLWVESQKASAVKKIVPIAHPQIKKIGNLLRQEFAAPSGAFPSYLDARARKVLVFSGKILDSRSSSIADRRIAAEAKKLSLETQERANRVLPRVAAAAGKMVKAHEAVMKALESDQISFGDIEAFIKSVEDLAAAAQVFATK